MLLKMRFPYGLFVVLLLYPRMFAEGQSTQDEWEVLFNGADLEGWTVRCLPGDRDKTYWKVVDGAIECNSLGDSDHHYVWLITEKEFADFHMKLEFQVFRTSPGNSGVQFRSRYDDTETARDGGWLNGPQADIHGPAPMRTGLIYDETEGVQRWIYPSLPDWNITREQVPPNALDTRLVYAEEHPEGWNRMEIICRGMHIETIVNGNRVTDFNAEGILNDELHQLRDVGSTGSIALQLHLHDELKIRFRHILIKEFK
jgi:hypothetical protein